MFPNLAIIDISYNKLGNEDQLLFLEYIETVVELNFVGNPICNKELEEQIVSNYDNLEIVNNEEFREIGHREKIISQEIVQDLKDRYIDFDKTFEEMAFKKSEKDDSDDDFLEYDIDHKFDISQVISKNKKFIRPQSANPNKQLLENKNNKLIKTGKKFKLYNKDFQNSIKDTLSFYKSQLQSRTNEFFNNLEVDQLFQEEKKESETDEISEQDEEEEEEEDKENSIDQEQNEIDLFKRKTSFTRPLSQTYFSPNKQFKMQPHSELRQSQKNLKPLSGRKQKPQSNRIRALMNKNIDNQQKNVQQLKSYTKFKGRKKLKSAQSKTQSTQSTKDKRSRKSKLDTGISERYIKQRKRVQKHIDPFEKEVALITQNMRKRVERVQNNRSNKYRRKIDEAINFSKWKLNKPVIVKKGGFK